METEGKQRNTGSEDEQRNVEADGRRNVGTEGKQRKSVALVAGIAAVLLCVAVGVASNGFGLFASGGEGAPSSSSQAAASVAGDESQSGSGEDAESRKDAKASSASSKASSSASSAAEPSAGASSSSGTSKTSSSASGKVPSKSSSSGKASSKSPGSGSSKPAPPQKQTISVTLLVDASAASKAGYAPTFFSATVELKKGSTAYDGLLATGLAVSTSQGANGAYVTAINGLAEKQVSKGSGWMYSVNGKTPMITSSSYELSDGDALTWYYVV